MVERKWSYRHRSGNSLGSETVIPVRHLLQILPCASLNYSRFKPSSRNFRNGSSVEWNSKRETVCVSARLLPMLLTPLSPSPKLKNKLEGGTVHTANNGGPGWSAFTPQEDSFFYELVGRASFVWEVVYNQRQASSMLDTLNLPAVFHRLPIFNSLNSWQRSQITYLAEGYKLANLFIRAWSKWSDVLCWSSVTSVQLMCDSEVWKMELQNMNFNVVWCHAPNSSKWVPILFTCSRMVWLCNAW